MTILKFNPEYNNFAGVCQVQGTLLNTPTWNVERNTNLGTIATPEIQFSFTNQESGEVEEYVVPAGNYTIGGSNSQYKPELHKVDGPVTFNINFTPGQQGPLFTFAPFNGVRGVMPTMQLVRKTVTDNVSATPAELQPA